MLKDIKYRVETDYEIRCYDQMLTDVDIRCSQMLGSDAKEMLGSDVNSAVIRY